ncbi:methionine ABC transporter substrate-binding protein [Prevotella pectinovora]|uniref:endonuclease MutS2 n=1 Tax=Prevotella pectinovora TaxID=1602169 RepID=UPI0005B6A0B2|nr:Smr/MutS family protein [Prevotella pectinovora]KIP60655.1 methionine ABC transporter substrate-binding protein [Prevotella pectinovora]
MIYPKTFEDKIGFNEIRTLLRERCLSSLGKEEVDKITFMDNVKAINTQLSRVREFRRLQEEEENFPLNYFFDVRQSVARLRLEGTHMEEDELFDLRRSLGTVNDIVTYLNRTDEDAAVAATDDGWRKDPVYPYPALHELAEGVVTFPQILQRIDQILDKFGKIRDTASPELLNIRRELAKVEGSISRTLYSILRSAQSEGLIEKDVTPAMRDGRLVIPVVPTMKRKIKGIVHDESASGKTLFIEPTEVVEANNRVRELEAEERREVIRILTEMAKVIRPHVPQILDSYKLLAQVDMLRAKTELAKLIDGIEPEVGKYPHIDWIGATHPLLRLSLQKQGKKVVPLEITLTRNKRMLIISGPNAGGKSVCLKTVGLVQYMLQCGLSVPVSERSQTGIFQNILIDIGDEQSIEDDLSTYSSHLTNMKNMMKSANDRTLILIDEFGTGTEPQIGGAIAEAVLKQFCIKRAYGVITTHYQNLKHFADSHEGVVNGAMLYDRHQMQALFQLQIGQPGSSFAIEIARKIGLPEQVIHDASEIVGSDYIQSDKYLQDIVRDKRYWESKRQTIHQREKQMEQTIAKYESEISDLAKSRKEVLAKAKERAEELFKESNKKIENVIREIREKQAEKEETKKLRDSLKDFKEGISDMDKQAEDDKIARKMAQILRRKENKKNRKKGDPSSSGQDKDNTSAATTLSTVSAPLKEGDTVRIKGTTSVGKIESIQGKNATVIFGDLRSTTSLKKLEHATAPKREEPRPFMTVGRQTRETIDEKKLNFKQDLDVRGMRGDEALNAVMYFIDDATLVGMSRVRILHGTGTGILRQLIRQYLATVPAVTSYKDEHVQFGGAGITVVDLG